MIPYIGWNVIQLGPISLQVWGLFVALGMLTGLFVAGKRAQSQGLSKTRMYDLGTYIIISAMVGARLMHSFVYDIANTIQDPLEVLRVWNGGFSVTGGFIGALVVGVWYLRRQSLDVWRYADAAIFGLPIGLAVGRIGCFLIHDHPGTATDFALGIQYPDGIVRHDHGLYLSMNGFLLAIVFWLMSRKNLPAGAYLAVFGIWYGCVRFGLDFYRAVDSRYFGLTPAQYVSILMVMAGITGSLYLLRQGRGRGKMHLNTTH